MNHYSEQQKNDIIARLINDEPVATIAEETRISRNTLYTWKYKARSSTSAGAGSDTAAAPSSVQKFAMVLEAATLNELETGEYCRKRGVYVEQLKRWREICAQANAQAPAVDRVTLREQARQIERLTAELSRKESALAEMAALMVLEKKVQNWAAKGPKPAARSVWS